MVGFNKSYTRRGICWPPPPFVVKAGLALIGAFGQACIAGLAETEDRKATLVTLLVTASGLSVGGIGSAFWGLAAGLVVLGLDRLPVGRS